MTARKPWNAAMSPNIISGIVFLADGTAVIVSSLAVYFFYVGYSFESFRFYLLATSINLAITLVIFHLANLYNFDVIVSASRQIAKVATICTIAFLILVTMAFATKISAQFSRVWGFSSYFIELAIICSLRGLLFSYLAGWAHKGKLTRKIAIIGSGKSARKLIERIISEKSPWNEIVGIFKEDLSPDENLDKSLTRLIPGQKLADEDLISFARKTRVDDVVVCLPWQEDGRINTIVSNLREIPVHLKLGPDLVNYDFPNAGFSSYSGVPVLKLADKPLGGWNILLKLAEDTILSAIIIILLSPLLLIIAFAIRIESRGPVIFKQDRYGFNNQIFKVYKFRSMYHREMEEEGVPQATKNDDRVTKVGRFLRRTSLDELPQLLNVLNGSMSLVGPRPHAVTHNEQYAKLIGGYFARHRVKPGITGWAQVNGLRGETDTIEKMEARVRYDIYYIENWSLVFDLKILLWTAGVVFFQDNAY